MKDRRRRWFRIAALLAPLLLLLLIELGLRLAGYGYATSFFLESGGVYIENQDFTRRYFPPGLARAPQPITVAATKPSGTCRIFVFGESAAMGDPEPAFGFPRILEVLLRERFAKPVEVINVAVTAINSHVIRAIAADCKALQGDLWIFYMGNNEVVGPFGAGTVFGKQVPSRGFIRLTTAIKATRVGQMLSELRRSKTPATWEGMEMFLDQQVRQSDPRMPKVYAHFSRNLRAIVNSADTEVILGTVASNLEGCPPFASLHDPNLTFDRKAEWQKLFEAGNYAEAAKIDPTHAELQFRLGQFVKARDFDTLRFRADSRLNGIIAEIARQSGGGFVDAAAQMRQEHFYEHVHFRFEGNYLLARMLAEEAVRRLPRFFADDGEWPSAERCSQLLAYTEWDQFQILDEMVNRLDLPPFTNQSGHAERMQRFRDERAELQSTLKPENHDRWIQTYRGAIAKAPRDWVMRENFARLLQHIGDPTGAEREWRSVTELIPHSAAAWYGLGNVLDGIGKTAEAMHCFRKALRLKPGAVEARNGLGLALSNQGKTSEAMREYKTALRQKPDFAEARVNLGLALAKTGDTNGAIEQYRGALRARTNSVAARINLGNALAARNDLEALTHYAEAVRLSPDLAQAQYLYGMALTKVGRYGEAIDHLQKAARLQPTMLDARFNLGVALAKQQRFANAADEFEAVLQLEPNHVLARKYLQQAQSRIRQGD